MTLIAGTKNYGSPIMVGDLLLSSDQVHQSIKVPTIKGNLDEYIEFDKYFPCGLVQKIYVIKPNICVALAGLFSEMKHFLIAIKDAFRHYEPNEILEDMIIQFLSEYNAIKQIPNSGFYLLYYDVRTKPKINAKMIWYAKDVSEWKVVKSKIFDEIHAFGSGAKSFSYFGTREAEFESSHPQGNIHSAVQANMIMFSSLFVEEMILGRTLKEYWGAGFECILFDGNTFMKLDETAFIVATSNFVNHGANLTIPIPHLVMYYKYYDEVLVITSIEINRAQDKVEDGKFIFTATKENYTISCTDVWQLDSIKALSDFELPTDLSFFTGRVAFSVGLGKDGMHTVAPSAYNDNPYEGIVSLDKEGNLKIEILKNTLDRLMFLAHEIYPTL